MPTITSGTSHALWWCNALVVKHHFIVDLCTAPADSGIAPEAN